MLAAIDARTPFNLLTGPLSRATLLRINEDEHVVLFTLHHIVSDGWSRDVLISEVASLYQAFRYGNQSPLEELEIHYADFASWQREYLSGEALEEQLNYWQKQLENIPEVLDLPTDIPRLSGLNSVGAAYRFALSSDLTRGLRVLGARSGATLFMVLLAGFKVLLYRYTGNPDIVVGTGIANRNQSEIEQLIGFFVNMLVLRTDLSGNPTFSELLKRVRQTALGAYAHQDLPFEMLVEKHLSDRDLSHSPLFQVALFLQNAATKNLELPGLALNYLGAETGGTHFDMTVGVTESADELLMATEYNTGLFEEATIKQMMEQFTRILEYMVKDPNAQILQVSLEKAMAAAVTEQHPILSTNDEAEQFDFTL
jgi:hypothetical protein